MCHLSLHDRLMTVHGFNVAQGHRTCSDEKCSPKTMRKGLQVGLPEQGCWAELRYFPDSTLGVRAVPALGPMACSLAMRSQTRCPLLALSRHAQCADECPLLGAKRTLTQRCLPSRFMSTHALDTAFRSLVLHCNLGESTPFRTSDRMVHV
jgi:hypothetical protein